MKHFILAVLVVFGAFCHAAAGSMEARFTNYNCSITFPAGWLIAKTPPQSMLVAGATTNLQMTVALGSFTIRHGDEKSALPLLNDSLKRLMSKGGEPVVEGQKNIGGIMFNMFTSKVSTKAWGAAYTASSGGRLYLIQTSSTADNATTDTNLLGVVNSFHLLSIPVLSAPPAKK